MGFLLAPLVFCFSSTARIGPICVSRVPLPRDKTPRDLRRGGRSVTHSRMNNPAPPRYEVTLDKAVPVPMRDGTRLAADVYRPRADGRFPAVVERTPYNREESVILRTRTSQYLAERGFAVVVQDVRGRFGS